VPARGSPPPQPTQRGGDGLIVEAACESSLSPTWRRGLQPHNPVSVPTGLRS
jgi:hypothetical protein